MPSFIFRLSQLAAAFVLALTAQAARPTSEIIVFNDDGCWNWLQDERVVVAGGQLFIGSVAAGTRDARRMGDIDVVSFDLKTRALQRTVLHHLETPAVQKQWLDDHNCPAFFVRPDGRVLALYAQLSRDEKFYQRISQPGGPAGSTAWGDATTFAPIAGSRVAFPNLCFLRDENGGRGRVLNFYWGHDRLPSWSFSDDAGTTWAPKTPPRFITGGKKGSPYFVKYAGNGRDTVHIAYTDGHRTNFHNSLFHVYYRGGNLHRSDGRIIRSMAEGLAAAEEATRVFQTNPASVAMISDLGLDADQNPMIAYSVQIDTAPLRPRPIGADHRYRLARWTGGKWVDREIAYAGGEVHAAKDDDCTGLIALDPQNANTVYISTNADPVTGQPLISTADQQRHWEIFRGTTDQAGLKWTWTALTRNSTADNIRPVVPLGLKGATAVIWLRGAMRMPSDYNFEVVGIVTP